MLWKMTFKKVMISCIGTMQIEFQNALKNLNCSHEIRNLSSSKKYEKTHEVKRENELKLPSKAKDGQVVVDVADPV